VYTQGATRYNIQDLAASAGANTIYSGTGVAGAYQSIGFGIAPDTVFAPGLQQQLVETWGMRGGFTHNWSPFWNTSVYGAYAEVRYNGLSKGLICGAGVFAVLVAGGGTCNPDYNIGQLGIITRWTPVKNLTFSADLTYTHLDQKMAGLVTNNNVATGKPTALYELKDQDTVLLLLRAQRNF
jgi:hypothetical protein